MCIFTVYITGGAGVGVPPGGKSSFPFFCTYVGFLPFFLICTKCVIFLVCNLHLFSFRLMYFMLDVSLCNLCLCFYNVGTMGQVQPDKCHN